MEAGKKKKPEILAFVSGKGGVGKTAITAALGMLLAHIGYRVLLIDSDLFTHGLTFLLGGNIREAGKKSGGIIERAFLGKQIAPVKIGERLHLIPSTTSPGAATSRMIQQRIETVMSAFSMILGDMVKRKEWDFIIIDSQPGPETMPLQNVDLASKTVVVMEGDPVSALAARNLDAEMKRHLGGELYHLVNKLFLFQMESYSAIRDTFRMIAMLPPIPFDIDVVLSFMKRVVPLDLDAGNAFTAAIIDCARDLIPETVERIDRLEESLAARKIKPIEKKIEELRTELTDLEHNKARILANIEATSSSMQYLNILRASLPLVAAVVSIAVFFAGGFFWSLQILFPVALTCVVMIAVLAYSVITRRAKSSTQDRLELQESLGMTERAIAEAYEEMSKYKVLKERNRFVAGPLGA